MKRHLIAIGLALSLSLGGCAAVERIFPPTTQVQASFDTVKKTLTVAEDAHKTTGAILEAAAKAGILKGTNAATAKRYYVEAGTWLDKAELAVKALNADGVLSAVSMANALLGKTNVLAKGN